MREVGNRPLPLPPRPVTPPAPRLTSEGLCSDCNVPAVVNHDGFFKLCPKCCGVLWTRYSAEMARKRAEEAAQRKSVSEEAAHRRHLLQIEKQRIRAAQYGIDQENVQSTEPEKDIIT